MPLINISKYKKELSGRKTVEFDFLFKIIFIYLFYFWLHGSLLLAFASLCDEKYLCCVQASHRGGF